MPDDKGTEKQPQPEDKEEDDKEKQPDEKGEEEEQKHSEQNQKQPEGEQTLSEKEAEKREEPYLADLELDLVQRPRSLGSNVIQESADYVLQLLHAYAAAFGL